MSVQQTVPQPPRPQPASQPGGTRTTIRPLATADAAELEAWHQVWEGTRAYDKPWAQEVPREWTVGSVAHPQPGCDMHYRVAEVGGVMAGVMYVELPLLDNTETALVDLAVLPEFRRRGVGRALWAEARTVAGGAGRQRLITESGELSDQVGPGSAFLEAMGMQRALENAMSVLDLDRVDDGVLARLHEEAAARADAGGYTLELWRGAPPEQHRGGIGALERTLSRDMPIGDLAWEPESWDAERVGAAWDAIMACGALAWHAAARHLATGGLVGWTVLVVWPSTRPWASQWATVVDPAHRGHRLGLLVKTANLAALRADEPGIRAIETYNAASNRPMLAVNEAMGFRKQARWWEWSS